MIEYSVIRDNKEKKNYWDFPKGQKDLVVCNGTEWGHLKTGDYTLKGHETEFVVERKANTGELGMNIFEARFEKELKRLDEFKYPFMIFEFDYSDVKLFPVNSGLPKYLWHKLKMNSHIMEQTIARYQIQYRTKIIFAGRHGQDAAQTLFKQVLKYGILGKQYEPQ